MPLVRLENFQQFAAINVLSDPGTIGGPVVIPNCMQVVTNWSLPGGKTAHNVMYGRTPAVPNPTVALADALFAALYGSATFTALRASFSTSVSVTGLTLRSVHTPNNALVASTAPAVVGTNPAIAQPNEVAVVLTTRTAFTGPSNRGRIYIPGWAVDTILPTQLLASASATALTNWANTIISAFSANALTFVIGQPARAAYTGSTGTQHPARQATSQTITSVIVRNTTFDSQRRRGLK